MSTSATRQTKTLAFVAAGIAAGIIGAWQLSANGHSGAPTGAAVPVTSITSTATTGTSGTSQPSVPASLPGSTGDDGGDGGHGGDR